jgi:hypothetical protein
MKKLRWLAWLLGAVAFWLTIGWFGIGALVVDPYFDRQIDRVVTAVAPGAPSKEDVAEIERNRASVFKGVGVIGGIISGFVFGALGGRFGRRND